MGVTATNVHMGRTDVSFGWSRDYEPTLVIASGTEVTVDIPECSNGQVGPDATVQQFEQIDFSQIDPISGPIYVKGAQPGDVLQVDVLRLIPGGYGWSANYPGTGLLTEDFPDAWLYVWDLTTGSRTRYVKNIWVPVEPMLGIVGCTPAAPGPHPAIPPLRTGGNMDCKYIREGTSVFLPVEVEGALLGIGDPHAAQGDGESGGSGIEAPMQATVRVSVRRDRSIAFPELEVTRPLERASAARAGYHVTTGIGSDLYSAARDAMRSMVARVVYAYGLDAIEAYGLCSVAADLKISEIVNDPNYVVSAFLPRDLFTECERP
jgi:acetamidase/formamidase